MENHESLWHTRKIYIHGESSLQEQQSFSTAWRKQVRVVRSEVRGKPRVGHVRFSICAGYTLDNEKNCQWDKKGDLLEDDGDIRRSRLC